MRILFTKLIHNGNITICANGINIVGVSGAVKVSVTGNYVCVYNR